MTTQQIRDYEKVQSLEILAMWTECVTQYKGMSLKDLPLRCAISDMESIIADEDAENYGDDTAEVVQKARWFLNKYKIDITKGECTMVFNYYNPHPNEKNVGDCVKRALTKASGKSYRDVSNELNRLKRSIGASAYNVKSVWDTYLREHLHATYQSYPAIKGQSRMNVERFCKEHKEGTYVLNVARHMVCCVDGKFYDTWDCSEKCVYGAYHVPTESITLEEKTDVVDTADEIAASPAPKMVPMPGIEKLADLAAEYNKPLTGNSIIEEMAILSGATIKKTKAGELWISLNYETHNEVLNALLTRKEYKHLRWQTRRGSSKSRIYDENTGMELILKNGSSAYLWCTHN